MPFNGSGTYTVPAGTAATTGTVIDSTAYNAFLLDIQNALSGSLRRNGENALQANLSAAGFRLTGLGNAIGPQDAATKAQLDAKFLARVLTGASIDGTSVPVIYPQGANSTSPETFLQIRERNQAGAQEGDQGAAPAVAFYWAGLSIGVIRYTGAGFRLVGADNTTFVPIEAEAFTGLRAFIGRTGSGNGGNIRYIDDTGTSRWVAGILGSGGAQNFEIFDQISGNTRFSVAPDGTLSGNGNGFTIGGRAASALKLLPTAGVELVSGEVYTAIDGFTVPTGLALNSIYPIYNDLTEDITITPAGGVTLRLAGTLLTGARTLGPKGFASLWVRGTNDYVMTGAGLS